MKTLKKVIILDHEPYSERKREHYFIPLFQLNDVEVEYWSLHRVLKYSKDIVYSYNDHTEEYLINFDSYDEFLERLLSVDPVDTLLIIECWFNISTIEIFEIILKLGFFWIRIDYYFNPTTYLNPEVSFLGKIFKKRKVYKVIESLKLRFLKKGVLNKPNILFLTGENRLGVADAQETVSLNYFDIEVYEKIKDEPKLLNYEYILFLDIMLVNHPDSQRIGYREVLHADTYFNKLNVFFGLLEVKYGMPVVIASHPKANYTNEFGDRKCIKNKTAELSIGADLIITHGSLSISYALLAQKKILYFYFESWGSGNAELRLLMSRMYKACEMLSVDNICVENVTKDDLRVSSPSVSKYENFLNLLYKSKNTDMTSNFELLMRSIISCIGSNAK